MSRPRAWNEERNRVDALLADIADREKRFMTITEVVGVGDKAEMFGMRVHLVNPGKHPASFLPDWTVKVTTASGEEASTHGTVLHDHADDVLKPMQQGDQFNVTVMFPYGEGIPNNRLLSGAKYTLSVSDIEGRQLIAEYPRV